MFPVLSLETFGGLLASLGRARGCDQPIQEKHEYYLNQNSIKIILFSYFRIQVLILN